MHPTPLRGLKIVAILKGRLGSTLIAIYWSGAGDAQDVGRVSVRNAASINNSVLWCFGKTTLSCHEGTNRAWDECPLCRVVPFKVVSTPRGANARCADCGSGQRCACCYVVRAPVVLSVILFKVFPTLRGMKARYAGVVPVSVVLPSAVARITSRSVVYASTWRSIKARAQPAVAADALRATRSRLF